MYSLWGTTRNGKEKKRKSAGALELLELSGPQYSDAREIAVHVLDEQHIRMNSQ